MKYHRIIALSIFMLCISFAKAQQIKSFEVLMSDLKSGRSVNAVIRYGNFELLTDNQEREKAPDAIGGMDINVWEYFAPNTVKNKEAFVVFSESKLIQNPKGDGYVYNYVKLRVDASGKVKISARYLDPKTLEVKMDENFIGEINDGKNEGGLFLYFRK
jgi:hypothetical protein